MRHRKEGRKLSRTASHRRALLSALSTALIKHKKIKTTLAKAKETRRIVEPLITRARNAHQKETGGGPVNVAARRHIAKFIRDKEAVKTLFGEIAEKIGDRAGGYTRVVKLGRRLGDGAELAVLELVDYNLAQEEPKKKTRAAKAVRAKKESKETPAAEAAPKKRTRRGKSKKSDEAVTSEVIEAKETEETHTTSAVDESTETSSDDTRAEDSKA